MAYTYGDNGRGYNMVSTWIKIMLAPLILSAVISILYTTGAWVNGPSIQGTNATTASQWQGMTKSGNITDAANTAGTTNGGTITAVSGYATGLSRIVFGTVYVKGLLDEIDMGMMPYTLVTTVIQGLLYTIVGLSLMGWWMSRETT